MAMVQKFFLNCVWDSRHLVEEESNELISINTLCFEGKYFVRGHRYFKVKFQVMTPNHMMLEMI